MGHPWLPQTVPRVSTGRQSALGRQPKHEQTQSTTTKNIIKVNINTIEFDMQLYTCDIQPIENHIKLLIHYKFILRLIEV